MHMEILKNPSLPGDRYDCEEKVFSSAALKFDESNLLFRNYLTYNSPDEHYSNAHRVDMSPFMKYLPDATATTEWPFNLHDIPLFGHLYVPTLKPEAKAKEKEVYPLAIFCHGDWGVETDSAAGYAYLGKHLATHGVITASVTTIHIANLTEGDDGNLLPDSGKRPVLILEYIKQFRAWNEDPSHPLHQKIDLSRVFLCGHSRGGEAAADAAYINTLENVEGRPLEPTDPAKPIYPMLPLLGGKNGLGPYGFGLRAVLTMAPSVITDPLRGDHKPYGNPDVMDNYFHIEGSDDHTRGHIFYDTATRNLKDPQDSNGKIKGAWRIYAGNHNYFNEVWTNSSDDPVAAQQQRTFAKLYVSSIVQALLLDSDAHRELLKDQRNFAPWLPAGRILVSQYQDSQRLFLQHLQESEDTPLPVISQPLSGSTDSKNLTVQQQHLHFYADAHKASIRRLKFKWQATSAAVTYTLLLDPVPENVATESYTVLAMGFGQALAEEGDAAKDQDITIDVTDAEGNLATFKLGSDQHLLYPDILNSVRSGTYYSVQMQTIRVPLANLVDGQTGKALNIRTLKSIQFTFDNTVSGVLYYSGIQLSR